MLSLNTPAHPPFLYISLPDASTSARSRHHNPYENSPPPHAAPSLTDSVLRHLPGEEPSTRRQESEWRTVRPDGELPFLADEREKSRHKVLFCFVLMGMTDQDEMFC